MKNADAAPIQNVSNIDAAPFNAVDIPYTNQLRMAAENQSNQILPFHSQSHNNFQIERNASDLPNEAIDRYNFIDKVEPSVCFYTGASLVAFIALAVEISFVVIWFYCCVGKEFKVLCINEGLVSDFFCLFSFGQLSSGVFVFSQIGVGLIGINQVGIMLFVGIGQVIGSVGFVPFAQVSSSTVIWRCQLGLALYKICGAQLGFHGFHSIIYKSRVVEICCRRGYLKK